MSSGIPAEEEDEKDFVNQLLEDLLGHPDEFLLAQTLGFDSVEQLLQEFEIPNVGGLFKDSQGQYDVDKAMSMMRFLHRTIEEARRS